jgi:glycosyltransferase involved in cell wall biosynthesis
MKILYLAVHRHAGWGAEHWLSRAFERQGCTVERYDYRQKRRQLMPWWAIRRDLNRLQKEFQPDVVLLQRAEKMPADVVRVFNTPVVFWSTEQLVRRRDVDQLLDARNLFAWVYVHTYTCVDYTQAHFQHLSPQLSVMHNATGVETLSDNSDRPRLAIFNRNLSPRRREWLAACQGLVEVIEGQFGERYFDDLSHSKIALNIHFSGESLDDFETGIYEAIASGCVVISETLNPRTVADLSMQDSIVQVDTPEQMRSAIEQLQSDPMRLAQLLEQGRYAIKSNLWDARATQMLEKFEEISVS